MSTTAIIAQNSRTRCSVKWYSVPEGLGDIAADKGAITELPLTIAIYRPYVCPRAQYLAVTL